MIEQVLEMFLRKMDAGLFTLQQVDYIITELCVCGIKSIKSRINTILGLCGESLDSVRAVMKLRVTSTHSGEWTGA